MKFVRKAWCSSCYRARRDSGEIQYDPLIWTLRLVGICLKHRRKLAIRCPNVKCNKTIKLLSSPPRIDHCSACNTFLGDTPPQDESYKLSAEDHRNQKLIFDTLSSLLSANDVASARASNNILTNNIIRFINRNYEGNVNKFSQDFGVPLQIAFSLYLGLKTPSLYFLINFSNLFNVSLLNLLTNNDIEL